MTAPIVIFGAGGFAREVLQVILDINKVRTTWEPVGFMVDADVVAPPIVHDLPVIRDETWLASHPEVQIIIAVGSSVGRHHIAARLTQACSNTFASLIHPKAWVGQGVNIGAGTVICAGALITTDIAIGNHVHINIGCTVGHDAVLHDFVTMNPSVNISGNVTVGTGSEIGTGSILIPHAHVGDWSIVGAGSVVLKPLESNVTAIGSPARAIKTRQPNWQLA
ncbi:MAG: acetyltransferase [Rugosibacter sp.]|nr:acetyltransferase [Rugosibacter sp.]